MRYLLIILAIILAAPLAASAEFGGGGFSPAPGTGGGTGSGTAYQSFTALTGGTAGCLDAVDTTSTASGTIAEGTVVTGSDIDLYKYVYNTSSSATATSPQYIKYTGNAGNGRWVLNDWTRNGAKQFSGLSGNINILTSGSTSGTTLQIVIPVASTTATAPSSTTVLTHASDGSADNAYAGMYAHNITKSVKGIIASSTATTKTLAVALDGGASFEAGDVIQYGVGPLQCGSKLFVTSTSTARHPTAVGCSVDYNMTTDAVLTVDFDDLMSFNGVLDSAYEELTAGKYITSPAAKGSKMSITNKTAMRAEGEGKRGTWGKEP